jgi:hypothetical protein
LIVAFFGERDFGTFLFSIDLVLSYVIKKLIQIFLDNLRITGNAANITRTIIKYVCIRFKLKTRYERIKAIPAKINPTG